MYSVALNPLPIPAASDATRIAAARLSASVQIGAPKLLSGHAAAARVSLVKPRQGSLEAPREKNMMSTTPRLSPRIARQRSVEAPREKMTMCTTPKRGGGALSPRLASPVLERSCFPHEVPRTTSGLQESQCNVAITGPEQLQSRVVWNPPIGTLSGVTPREKLDSTHEEIPTACNCKDSDSLLKEVRDDLRTLVALLAKPAASLTQRVQQFEQIAFTRLRDLEQKIPCANISGWAEQDRAAFGEDNVGLKCVAGFVRNPNDRVIALENHSSANQTLPSVLGRDLEIEFGKDDTESQNTWSDDGSVIVANVVRRSLTDRLGLDVRQIDGQLCFERIEVDGAVAKANMRNLTMDPPGQPLGLGDVFSGLMILNSARMSVLIS